MSFRFFISVTVLAAVCGLAADLDQARARLADSQSALARGDYATAITAATTAEALFRAAGDTTGAGKSANQAGLGHLYRSEYTVASECFGRALAAHLTARDAESEITVRNNIGNVYFFQGRYLEALQAYETALARSTATPGQPWSLRRRQLTLVNLGVLYEQLGQNERALDYYRQANVTPTGLPPAEQAQMLANLGTLYRRMGDAARALTIYEEAQRQFDRQQHFDGEIHTLHNIGILMTLDYHDVPRALRSFDQAIALARRAGNKRQAVLGSLFRGEALSRAGRIEEARAAFADALAGARESGAAEERWTALFGLGRIDQQRGDAAAAQAEYQEALATVESLRAGLGRASLKTDFLANKRDVYDAAISLQLDTARPDATLLFGLMEHARARTLQDSLQRSLGWPSLAAVQQRLAPGSLLVEYWMGRGRGAVLWATREAAGIAPLAFSADTAVEAFAGALDGGEWRSQSRRLGAQLLDAVPSAGVRSLVVVPDGALQRIPFEALEWHGKLLVEAAPVSYMPSASMLMRAPAARRWRAPWQVQVAAFGDPRVPAGADAIGRDMRWALLPHAARELRDVAAALPGASSIYQGEDDWKSRLYTSAAWPVMHFSTHAAVDVTDANRSRIVFTPEPGRPGSEYLFWREAGALNLNDTELVTLSACETEGGRMVKGEGVLSFSRAFLAAGSRSTVTTLWRVADQATAELMRQFYYRLGRGESKAEALRQAKLSFLASGGPLAHPRYWAAFILSGDGDSPLAPVVRWSWLAPAALGVGLVAWFVVRSKAGKSPA